MQKAALAVFGTQFLHQLGGVTAFGGAQCVNIPLSGITVVGSHKGRLSTHGQTHITFEQVLVYCFPECQYAGPLVLGVGLGHTRRFINTLHAHVVGKLDFRLIHAAFNGCRTRRLRRTGQWNMTFTGHQA